jgi:uncharacterized protein (DUF1501 family)
MLNLVRRRASTKCDGTSRREFLQAGTLGLLGLTLPGLLRLQSVAAVATGKPLPKKSIILLFLDGGAAQHETFDPKPEAPVEYRSLFGAINTKLSGVQFGSHLVELAKRADRMSIVRTLEHTDGDHGGATHWMKTGHPWPPAFLGKAPIIPQVAPAIGAVAAKYFEPVDSVTGVPRYVRVLSNHGGYPGDDAAWLGAAHSPIRCGRGENTMLANMSLRIEPDRLGDRKALLASLDRIDRRIDESGIMSSFDAFTAQAVDVLRGQAKDAFDLEQEDPKTRAAYGSGLGEELLLARRLCEAGTGFVTLNNGYWDHHGGIIPGINELCPPLDRAVSAYIDDVTARGLFDDILLVVTGEFGRTPRINGGPGRDHWAPINNAVFIGGGLKMGQVVGESDSVAAYPALRPVSVADYMATLLHVLGIPVDLQYIDPNGRPRYMVEGGELIRELV